MLRRAISIAIVLCGVGVSPLLSQTCTAGTVYLPYNTIRHTHNVLRVTDPAGQQTATFDLYWGGSLTSLVYAGTEYIDQIWAQATGGLVQLAFHDYAGPGQDYNPTQAGANPAWPSEVLGAATVRVRLTC